jgi:hypothetical protein
MNRGLPVNDDDSRQALASRIRALREERWAGKKVNQAQLAAALSGDGRRSVSVPLISSWESRINPTVPPRSRIEDIATFFASPRSFDGQVGRLLSPDEMTVQEWAEREQLLEELTRLRGAAHDAAGMSQRRDTAPSVSQEINQLKAGPYHFKPGDDITIVCAQLPPEMLERMPYTDPSDPDFIALYRYSDLDSLLELFGHLRAANPASRVEFRAAHELRPDDYTPNLVSLGGVDWNLATMSILDRLQLPVTQVAKWQEPAGAYFEVPEKGGGKVAHRPVLETAGDREMLREDVALFARAVSPFNRKRFVTICNGMYGRGTYGAVRALTDERFRDRNAEYLQKTFGDSEAFCLLTRVTVEHGVTLTPDWTAPKTVLFKWSR